MLFKSIKSGSLQYLKKLFLPDLKLLVGYLFNILNKGIKPANLVYTFSVYCNFIELFLLSLSLYSLADFMNCVS